MSETGAGALTMVDRACDGCRQGEVQCLTGGGRCCDLCQHNGAQVTPPALIAQAIHDVTCPEGPDCRDRLLHSAGQPLAYTGVLDRFLVRLRELESASR